MGAADVLKLMAAVAYALMVSFSNVERLYAARKANGLPFSTAEHAFEKQILKRFFYSLRGNRGFLHFFNPPVEPIATCKQLRRVFQNPTGKAGSRFQHESAATRLGKAFSCWEMPVRNCPDNTRVQEFFMLDKNINRMKALVSYAAECCSYANLGL